MLEKAKAAGAYSSKLSASDLYTGSDSNDDDDENSDSSDFEANSINKRLRKKLKT